MQAGTRWNFLLPKAEFEAMVEAHERIWFGTSQRMWWRATWRFIAKQENQRLYEESLLF